MSNVIDVDVIHENNIADLANTPTLQDNASATADPAMQSEHVVETPNRPAVLTDFLNSQYPAGLMVVNGIFYCYINGYWQPNGPTEIRRRIAEHYGAAANERKTRHLLGLLRDFLSCSEQEVEPDRNLICLTNGTFNTTTYVLEPHSPDHLLRNRLPITWNADAQCPRWLQFLNEIFANDPDRGQKIAFLQQWFGYCLVPDNSMHKFLLMVGGGANGKSVLLKVLSALVGTENVSHAHLEQLGKTFVRADLKDKLVNISPEISTNAKLADGYLKQIVAGDTVEAERKFKDSFSYVPYVRFIAATNQLPKLTDTSEGFFRRAIILPFNRTFTQAEQNPRLLNILLAELPGIFTWAIAGLQSLRAQGHFTMPESSIAALNQYRAESDFEQLFADTCLISIPAGDGGGMAPSEIHDAYTTWCLNFRLPRKNGISFGKRLAAMGFSHRSSNGKKYWLVSIHNLDGNLA
jgi:putative DNA primase/helicase